MSSKQASERVELAISALLRWGVAVSLVLLAGGTLLCYLRGGDYGVGGGTGADLQRLLHADEGFPRSLSWLAQGLCHANGAAIIVLGLLLLIATPVVRVLVSIVAFAVEKDRAYVVITAIVFLLLMLSFALGKAG